MKKILFCFAFFFLGINTIAYCGQTNKIELTDGSVIDAEIISFENNIYTLNTTSLGEIKVAASKIRKIEIASQNTLDTNSIQSQTDKIKQKVMANPEIMKDVSNLANTAEFQDLMKSPEIVNAAKSGDIKALMQNQKFMELINNPKIKEIGNKLKDKN